MGRYFEDHAQIDVRLIHYELIKDDRQFDLISILICRVRTNLLFVQFPRTDQLNLRRNSGFFREIF